MKESKRISVAEDNKILSKKNLDLQTRYNSLMKEAMGMREALDKLAKRHAWTPGMGDCICQPHLDTHEAIASFDKFLKEGI